MSKSKVTFTIELHRYTTQCEDCTRQLCLCRLRRVAESIKFLGERLASLWSSRRRADYCVGVGILNGSRRRAGSCGGAFGFQGGGGHRFLKETGILLRDDV